MARSSGIAECGRKPEVEGLAGSAFGDGSPLPAIRSRTSLQSEEVERVDQVIDALVRARRAAEQDQPDGRA